VLEEGGKEWDHDGQTDRQNNSQDDKEGIT
jgi:hypothetical protein